MTLGEFGDIWDEIEHTRHEAIGDYPSQAGERPGS